MTKLEVMRFSLRREKVPVELENEAGGIVRYQLVEMDGKSRDAYMNRVREFVLVNTEGKVVGFKTFEGMQSSLLVFCLKDQSGECVSEETIQSFPTRVLTSLFEKAQMMNGLQAEPEKNVPPASGSPGSDSPIG